MSGNQLKVLLQEMKEDPMCMHNKLLQEHLDTALATGQCELLRQELEQCAAPMPHHPPLVDDPLSHSRRRAETLLGQIDEALLQSQ